MTDQSTTAGTDTSTPSVKSFTMTGIIAVCAETPGALNTAIELLYERFGELGCTVTRL